MLCRGIFYEAIASDRYTIPRVSGLQTMPACTHRSALWQTLGLLSVIGQEQKRVRKTGRWVENEN